MSAAEREEWVAPRCKHGSIILGCGEADCDEQNEYLEQMEKAAEAYVERQRYILRMLFLGKDQSSN